MSRTYAHKPWKYTEYGKQTLIERDKFFNGEISLSIYRGLSDTYCDMKFALPRRAREIRRDFNRRDRHNSRAILKRSQSVPQDWIFLDLIKYDEIDAFLYWCDEGLFDYCDEQILDLLPKKYTGRNRVRWDLF